MYNYHVFNGDVLVLFLLYFLFLLNIGLHFVQFSMISFVQKLNIWITVILCVLFLMMIT